MASDDIFHSDGEAPQPIAKGEIFERLQANNIKPGDKTYVAEIMNEAISLNNVAASQINTASIKELENQAQRFADYVRRKYKESKINGSVNSFRTKCSEIFLKVEFSWTPDLQPTEELVQSTQVGVLFAAPKAKKIAVLVGKNKI